MVATSPQHTPRPDDDAHGAQTDPVASSQDFFSAHGISREELPPDTRRQIELLDQVKQGGVDLTPAQLEQVQRVLATQGEALRHLGSTSQGLLSRLRAQTPASE